MKIEINGTGTIEEIIRTVELSLNTLKAMQQAKVKIGAVDEDLSGTWSDAISETKLTR